MLRIERKTGSVAVFLLVLTSRIKLISFSFQAPSGYREPLYTHTVKSNLVLLGNIPFPLHSDLEDISVSCPMQDQGSCKLLEMFFFVFPI